MTPLAYLLDSSLTSVDSRPVGSTMGTKVKVVLERFAGPHQLSKMPQRQPHLCLFAKLHVHLLPTPAAAHSNSASVAHSDGFSEAGV